MARTRLQDRQTSNLGATSLSAFMCPGTLQEFARERNRGEEVRRVVCTLLSGQTRSATVWGTAVLLPRRPPAGVRYQRARAAAVQAAVAPVALHAALLPEVSELIQRFRLTAREAEVAMLLAQRRTNKEIARALAVTTHTAKRHTERVLGKLGINSRRHVVAAITSRTAGAKV
jgi:DNA-binding CsgD family transcriptional regulator